MSAARPSAASSSAAAAAQPAAATQTIPPSSSDGSTVAKSATGDFPLAAIICVAIVGGIIFLLICYRLYVRWWRRRKQSYDAYAPSSDEPKSPNPLLQHHHPLMTQRATMSGSAFSPFSPSPSTSTLLYPAYAHGSYSSRGSLAALSSEGSLSNIGTQPHFFGGGAQSAESSHSLSTSDSRMAALNQLEGATAGSSSSLGAYSRPTSPQGCPRPNSHFGSLNYIRGDSSMSTDQLRVQGSRLSTFQAATRSRESLGGRRSMLSPTQFGSQSSLDVPSTSRPGTARMSGAPHLRHSRIEIVPPQPLAPPPGTVVAADKSTLAFSPLSGIGSPDSMPASVSGWFKPEQGSSSNASTASSSSSERVRARQTSIPDRAKRSTASESTTRSGSEGSSVVNSSISSGGDNAAAVAVRTENDNAPRSASPQSPLDKLKKQLEGHASQMSSSGSPDRRRDGAASGIITQEDIEAYRRG